MKKKTICIIILNWNGKNNTVACLQSLQAIEEENYVSTTIVVDNDSSDNSVSAIQKEFPQITIIQNDSNRGYTGGMNRGIAYALEKNADYILLLNNDTIVDKKSVSALFSIIDSNEKIGVVVPKIFFSKGSEFHKSRYKANELGKVIWYAGGEIDWKNIIGYHTGVDEVDKGQYDATSETLYATGCCMMIKREVLEIVGLLDDNFYLYYEDSDFSLRVKNSNYKIVFVPQAHIWHKNAGSAGGSGSGMQDYYITRNRMLFGLRYGPKRVYFFF